MITLTLHIVRYCANECARQQSGEESVARMVEAFREMASHKGYLSPLDVITLAHIIEPDKNDSMTVRTTPVSFRNGNVVQAPSLDSFKRLIHYGMGYESNADDFYQAFEEMHPFNDGNGRVGSMLWNRMNGTVRFPLVPPPFKN